MNLGPAPRFVHVVDGTSPAHLRDRYAVSVPVAPFQNPGPAGIRPGSAYLLGILVGAFIGTALTLSLQAALAHDALEAREERMVFDPLFVTVVLP